jgi:hypothetical protein
MAHSASGQFANPVQQFLGNELTGQQESKIQKPPRGYRDKDHNRYQERGQ